MDDRMSAPAPVPAFVGRILRDPVDERSVARMWRRIAARRAQQPARTAPVLGWALLGAGAAMIVMTILIVVEQSKTKSQTTHDVPLGALVRSDGDPFRAVNVPAGSPSAGTDLADGSRIILGPGSAVEPLASSGREFIVRLSAGTATFDVEPFGPRRWIVEAGLASVEVVGTRFTVSRRVDSVRVDVERGSVLVRGATVPDGVVRLEAGRTMEVVSTAAPPVANSGTPRSAHTSDPEAPAAKPTESAPEPRTWRSAAESGNYTAAYGDLGADGIRRESARAGSGDDLFALADVARLSGHPAEAVTPLERLESEFSSSPRAPLAAVTLGRIELDLGNAARASQAFERALALHIPAGLEEDVYARLVEALVKSGNRGAALSARDEYRARFPQGRRKADIERWLAR